jgi:hypothetical protein
MHYIAGTSFSLKPDPRRGFASRENQFKVGILYRLSNILKKNNDLLTYVFYGNDRSTVELEFDSARAADVFIANIRKEQIPDYTQEIGKIDL